MSDEGVQFQSLIKKGFAVYNVHIYCEYGFQINILYKLIVSAIICLCYICICTG